MRLAAAKAVVGAKRILLGSITVVWLAGQQLTPGPKPKLEVASIKPSPGRNDVVWVRFGSDRIILENYPVREMIGAAYGVRAAELIGGPQWINSTRYDITAKAERPANIRALWTMMQSVLEERFRLKLHHEKREVPVFDLTISKPSKFQEFQHNGECVEGDPTAPLPQATASRPVLPRCGMILFGPAKPTGLQLSGTRIRMDQLALRLTDIVGRRVVDKTGSTGTFNLYLKFARDDMVHGIPQQPPGLGNSDEAAASDPSGLPSIFSALRNQLGLKLDSARGLIDFLVIDSVERPTAN